MNEDIITIVTPSYNQGEFIEETIQSVLKQKGNFFIDYVIMDGGSKDQSVEVIKKYEDLLKENCDEKEIDGCIFYIPRAENFEWNRCRGISYRWISEKDGGQVNALNNGFEKAIGEVYVWLNSDDYFLNENVFTLVSNAFQDEKLDVFTADGIFSDREGKKTGEHAVGRVNLKELIYLDYHIFQPATFFHKSILKKHKLNRFMIFDADFFISVFSDKIKYIKSSEKIAGFRMYGENITDNKKLRKRAFKEKILIMKKYSKNRLYFLLGAAYQFFSLIVKDKFEKLSFGRKIYSKWMESYRSFCYRKIKGEKYEDR